MRFELGKLELFGLDLSSLWQYWWRGLNSLSPVPLAQLFMRPAPKLCVYLESEQIRFVQALPEKIARQLVQLGYPEFDVLEDRSLHEQLTKGVNKKLLQLDLVLPQENVLRCKVSVPAAARSNLRQVLGFQINKLTPFSRDQVLYDVVETGATSDSGMLEVELLVVPKVFATRWMEQVTRITGLPIARLRAGSTDGQPGSGNLLGELGVPSHWGRRLNRNSGLLLLLIFSLGLVMVAPVVKLRMLTVQSKQEIIVLTSKVSDAKQQWYDLQQGTENLLFMLEQHNQRGKPALVLDELTRLIPDNIFLTSLTLEKDRVELGGQGSNVVDLVEMLNASEVFEQAKFASAITRGRDNLDVFVISAQLVGLGEQP